MNCVRALDMSWLAILKKKRLVLSFPPISGTFAGLAPSNENPKLAKDKRTYTTLAYSNGPGASNTGNSCYTRKNRTHTETGC